MDVFEDSSSDEEEEESKSSSKSSFLVESMRIVGSWQKKAKLVVAIEDKECVKELRRGVVFPVVEEVGLDEAEKKADVVILAEGTRPHPKRGGFLMSPSPSPPSGPEWVLAYKGEERLLWRRRAVTADIRGHPPWGPADDAEHARVESITAVDENDAADKLKRHGACVLPGFADVEATRLAGEKALDRFEACRLALLHNHRVDLLNPDQGEPTYRELSAREDYRCDVALDRAFIFPENIDLSKAQRITRTAATTIEPTPDIDGNYGRYNFNDSGPRTPRAPMPAAAAGAVVSLPGAADQALHADTAHLFDHVDLPGHYFNLFIIAPQTVAEASAGLTAFVLGTHRLRPAALVADDRSQLPSKLVRPRLQPGDALIFDARILHFGLPHTGSLPRPLLYCNLHEPWFTDPKNWDHASSVFSPQGATNPTQATTG